MKNEQLKIQKNISLVISLAGLLVALNNVLILVAQDYSYQKILIRPTVLPLLIFALLFFVTRNFDHVVVRILQILIIYLNGILAIMDDHEAFNGYGFIILSVLMLYKYGFLKRRPRIKLIGTAVSVTAVLELSIHMNTQSPMGKSLNYLVYFILFFTITYMLYSSELNRILRAEKRFKETLESKEEEMQFLLEEVDSHKSIIEKKEARIDRLKKEIRQIKDVWKPVNLKDYNITNREESVIRALCHNTGMTNKELAAEIGISEGSIKQNMNKIFKKLEVANRQQLIEMCQRNYLKTPVEIKS
ncbi:MAG: LuxR C-terminal-related transcriptional regulator [Spirochaetales bacterium]|nr:LuxR C-terminal-related transcriptional regulator [Spirochaetales bacterium]